MQVLFHRDFQDMTGGHLVHAQYMRMISAMAGYDVRLYMTPRSAPIALSPWASFADRLETTWDPEVADLHFVAGFDWLAHPRARALEREKPFINLIQGVRHADPQSPLYEFLDRRAIRICVSEPVQAALVATGRCNGPVVTIRNALDPDLLTCEGARKEISAAIVAVKQPRLAEALGAALVRAGIDVDVIHRCDRPVFLSRIARARVVVTLPQEREGFYLPALEAMALGCLVVCPDAVGNRGYCEPGVNCLMPAAFTFEALLETAQAALSLPDGARAAMVLAARATARAHGEGPMATSLARILEGL